MKIIFSVLLLISFVANAQQPPLCRPQGKSCFETACSLMSDLECNEEFEINQVLTTCQGSYDGNCIQESVKYLREIDFNDWNEMSQLVKSCTRIWDMNCTHSVCKRLGGIKCNELSEIVLINNKCSQRF